MHPFRPVAVLILSVLFVQLAGGISGLVTPLGLEAMSMSSFLIGLTATGHALGFLVGALFANNTVKRIGNIRTFTVAAAANTISFMVMGLMNDPIVWALARILQGAGFALMFTALEAWLGSAVARKHRGSVLGVYHLSAKTALFLGPLMFSGLAEIDTMIFIVCAIFMCAASLPLGLTYQLEPKPRKDIINQSFIGLMRLSPGATFGVFVAGLANTGVMALLPIYAQDRFASDGSSDIAAASYLIAAAMIGGMISQWPAGKLSDTMDRRYVVITLGLIASAVSLALLLFPNVDMTTTILMMVVWGAGALSFYGICVAHGMDHADTDDMSALMSVYLFTWALGSVIGPAITGALMATSLGAQGLFMYSLCAHGLLAVIMFARSAVSDPAPEDDQEDWSPVTPRSTLGSELDPRVEG